MEQYFDVWKEKKKVGSVRLIQEGLYYKIHCRTGTPGNRLFLHTSETVMDLGICVPIDNEFGFDTKKSMKSIQGTIEKFSFSGAREEKYLIEPANPFKQLPMLARGRLQIHDGRYYMIYD